MVISITVTFNLNHTDVHCVMLVLTESSNTCKVYLLASVIDMCLDSSHITSELQAASLYRIDPSRRDAMTERYQAVRKGCHACLQLSGIHC